MCQLNLVTYALLSCLSPVAVHLWTVEFSWLTYGSLIAILRPLYYISFLWSGKLTVKERPQKSKKAANAKETKQKGSAKTNSSSARNTVDTKSRKPKDAVLPNASSSADQTAAG